MSDPTAFPAGLESLRATIDRLSAVHASRAETALRARDTRKDPMRFLLLLLNLNPGLVVADVQRQFETPPMSFCRLASNVWLLHTELLPRQLEARFAPLALPAGSMLLTEMELLTSASLLSREARDWIFARIAEDAERLLATIG